MSSNSSETGDSVRQTPNTSVKNSPDNSPSPDTNSSSADSSDPLYLTENDLKKFEEESAESKQTIKRKLESLHLENFEEINKKQKTDDTYLNEDEEDKIQPPIKMENEFSSSDSEDSDENEENSQISRNLSTLFENELKVEKEIEPSELISENTELTEKKSSEDGDDDFDITEKLKEMGEISVKAVSKSDASKNVEPVPDNVEITKKDKKDLQDRKVTNLRKNIKEVIDESQLDAATLAAQRQESERLARVQEQQRIIREVQRQIAIERQTSKTQQKILTFLQNHAKKSTGESGGSLLKSKQSSDECKKIALTPSVSIQPTSSKSSSSTSFTPLTIKSFEKSDDDSDLEILQDKLEELKELRNQMSDDEEDEGEDDDDEEVVPIEDKKNVVTIDSSSDDDDCIILSDDEEVEEEEEDPHNSGLHVKDAYNVPNSDGKVVVNIGHPENEPDIFVAPQIEKIIKPHQIGGVRFLFDNIIESIDRFSSSTGFGCILAHSMGLGKTLQLCCFCDIFLRHTSSKTILIIMPINTLQNWMSEFNTWLPAAEDVDKSPLKTQGEVRPRNFNLHVLNDSHKTLNARAKVVFEWVKNGGVLLMGYEMYRLLSQKKMNKPKKSKKKMAEFPPASEKDPEKTSAEDQDMFDKIHEALVKPGPDLVVCDEGHRIKNSHASISLALKQIKSKRRIVLTGYPLQNNLMEYWCMVDFVRPNYLGSKQEFSNMFERPILNGQCVDSTPQDVKLMRYRAHVLHSLLVGFVQRRSHVVLQSCLPKKEEYVLLVRMTPFQRKLYDVFMNTVVRTKQMPNPLKAFSVCCKIWNHPDVLYNFLKKREADLEIELEEAEANVNKNGTANGVGVSPQGPKKRGRKKVETKPKANGKGSKLIPAAAVTPNSSSQMSTLPKSEMSNNSSDSNLTQLANLSMSENGVTVKKENESMADEFRCPTTTSSSTTSSPSLTALLNTKSNPPPYGTSLSTNSLPSTSSSFGNSFQNSQNYNYNYQNPNYNGNQSNYYNSNGNNYWDNQQYYNQQNYWGNQQYWNNPNNPNPYDSTYENKSTFFPEPEKKPIKAEVEAKPEEIIPTSVHEVQESKEKLEKVKIDDDPLASLKEKEKEEKELGLTYKSSKDDGIPYDWAVELMKDYVSDLLENSSKMELFFCILQESIKLGDRILVFSQSLLTLNLMERLLQRTKVPESDNFWAKNQSYFRLDGSTPALDREKLINEFNSNSNVKLFLVSTRAGSLGINLVGANRVIIFDASWNPCHDTQAVCRVYRYGQKRSCFVYRLVMDNCLEKKIYDRQINKQGMSDRVVDECNPDAHLSMKEVTSLCWDDGIDPPVQDYSKNKDKHVDLVMKLILEMHSKSLTKEPFRHESLLVDRKEKKLSVAEKRMAKRGYELEKQAASKPSFNYNSVGTSYRMYRTGDGSIVHRPVASVRPMQAELGDINPLRTNNMRPNRWIPAEVWQRQGMNVQEMTLPLDVVIPTSSADKQNIVLKAGQKVMVLKSPKGIYMQLETGKIIAIRTSMKMNSGGLNLGTNSSSGSDKPTFTSMQESAQTNNMPANLRNQAMMAKNPRFSFPRSSLLPSALNEDEVINISNDEDEDDDDDDDDNEKQKKKEKEKEKVKEKEKETTKEKEGDKEKAKEKSKEKSDEKEKVKITEKNKNNVGKEKGKEKEKEKVKPMALETKDSKASKTPPAIIQSVEKIDVPVPLETKPVATVEAQNVKHPVVQPLPASAGDSTYKEKVFKPNLVGRKPKVPPPVAAPVPIPNANNSTQNQNTVAPYSYHSNPPPNYNSTTPAINQGTMNYSTTNQRTDYIPPANNYPPSNYRAGSSHQPYYGNSNYNYNANYHPTSNTYPPKHQLPQYGTNYQDAGATTSSAPPLQPNLNIKLEPDAVISANTSATSTAVPPADVAGIYQNSNYPNSSDQHMNYYSGQQQGAPNNSGYMVPSYQHQMYPNNPYPVNTPQSYNMPNTQNANPSYNYPYQHAAYTSSGPVHNPYTAPPPLYSSGTTNQYPPEQTPYPYQTPPEYNYPLPTDTTGNANAPGTYGQWNYNN